MSNKQTKSLHEVTFLAATAIFTEPLLTPKKESTARFDFSAKKALHTAPMVFLVPLLHLLLAESRIRFQSLSAV